MEITQAKSVGIVGKLKLRVQKDRSFLVKFFSTSVSRGISAFGTMFFNFVLARQLGTSHFGQFMLAYSLLMGLGIFSKFGMDQALLKFAGILFHDKDFTTLQALRKEVFLISTLVSILLAGALYLLRDILAARLFGGVDFAPVLVIFSIALPFYANTLLQSTYLKAFKKPEMAPFLEIGLLAFLTGIAILISSFCGVKITPYSASVIFLISNIVVLAVGQILLERVLRPFYKEAVGVKNKVHGFYSSLPDYALSSITIYLLKFSPSIILGIYATHADIGLYSIANNTAFLINFILLIVNSVTAPYFATYYKEGNLLAIKKLLQSSTLYMLCIALPIFFIIMIFPSKVLSVFGPGFSQAKVALMMLAVCQLYNVATGPVYFLLNMTGHQRHLRNIVFLTAFISVALSFVLIPHWSYNGAAVATCVGLLLQNSLSFYHTRKHIGINVFARGNKY